MTRKEGVSKIEKFLITRGYKMNYFGFNYFRYKDNFHSGYYTMDMYQTSNGWYILCKTDGKKRYYLSKSSKLYDFEVIDFSQEHFIKRIEQYFSEELEGEKE